MLAKISVVIPVYNLEAYIEKCLDSVLAQTFRDFECILINDGSTDRTGAILESYAKKDDRIQVIHKENEGVSKARNVGIQRAVGEYFCFFDGDDFMEPETLEELYDLALKKQADTVVYGYYRYEEGKVKETCPPCFLKDWYEGGEVISEVMPRFIGLSTDRILEWLEGKEGALQVENPALWRCMTSARLIREHQLYFREELSVGEDTLFISEYMTLAQRVCITQKCYYYLVTRESSAIYGYERAPLRKLDQKKKQLKARLALTDAVKKRCGIDIRNTWQGTIVMSSVELAFLLSLKLAGKSRKERYRLYLTYVSEDSVQECVETFSLPGGFQFRKLPFIFLKKKWYAVLFLACEILHIIGYEFSRS